MGATPRPFHVTGFRPFHVPRRIGGNRIGYVFLDAESRLAAFTVFPRIVKIAVLDGMTRSNITCPASGFFAGLGCDPLLLASGRAACH